ncbi:MAG TPA: RNA methyltransferase [Kiritimatiellia bacterium]|nr:RNA methyltransferase [Kiritimatiellia bacterium]HMO98091.1 RNA methyltransferase [Kiritimatiellia bacterium]HMP96330.1 RNA methyltransferase [Kiritimatiellia bacterium]
MNPALVITSPQNPRVKEVVKLRKRGHRDTHSSILIEGYREVKRAVESRWPVSVLFYCPEHFIGENEGDLLELCRSAGVELIECAPPVFEKMAYRDRPEGLLALGAPVAGTLDDLHLGASPLVVIAEAIEKPGNLGSLLRSADAAGVDAVIVCDPLTDINNPNVVRSSVGTLFTLPVVQAEAGATLAWCRAQRLAVLAATPEASLEYTEADMTRGVAIVVGTEKFGLSDLWMGGADVQVRIPMLGKIDSLNVTCAATILLYEAVRQRRAGSLRKN